MVIRVPYGGGIGGVEHHSDSSEVYYTHTPGLRVVTPGTPADAYTLLRQAIDCPDPVIFLEPKRRYWATEAAELGLRPGPDIATAWVRRRASRVCLIETGVGGRRCARESLGRRLPRLMATSLRSRRRR